MSSTENVNIPIFSFDN